MNPDIPNTSYNIKIDSPMEDRLFEACSSGDVRELKDMVSRGVEILLRTTPQNNTCLHISAMFGHEEFSTEVVALNQSLLTSVNLHGETPLIIAVIMGSSSLAETLMKNKTQLREMLLKADKNGNNALHHALRNGQTNLALAMIIAEPLLSRQMNKMNESPMFIAASRGFTDVLKKLLEIPFSEHQGPYGRNALHAAMFAGNVGITEILMEKRPKLAHELDQAKCPPLHYGVVNDRKDLVRVILERDASLGYVVNNNRVPYLNLAAFRGNVKAAEEILRHCPDAPYCEESGWSTLHVAITADKTEFVEFILRTPQLIKHVINMREPRGNGDTALHIAVRKSNSKIVRALLAHKGIDPTIMNNNGEWPADVVFDKSKHANTLNWNEILLLLAKADPNAHMNLYRNLAKKDLTEKAIEQIKSLTETYTSNTSLIAILIATITFAAAFTLPGGYSNNQGREGLPIMAKKFVFKVFIISDTLAMCSSLAVAFTCILARWEDLDFLLHYRSSTKKMMWFAYMATLVAFATGFYTVVAPTSLWLAISVCSLCFSLPVLTNLLGEWPIYKLRFRLGYAFKYDILDMV